MVVQTRIVTQASEMFLRNGIRSVTMNDIAESLGISKRTLYEHFSNKEALLSQCIDYIHAENLAIRRQQHLDANNTVDFIHRHFRYALERINSTHPNFINELYKYHPKIWNTKIAPLMEERETFTRQLIQDGIEEGYFLSDTNPEIATKLLYAQVDMISDLERFPPERFTRHELIRHITISFIRGLATEKGLKDVETLFYDNN
ncbi:MAG: TetR/AcrR family transcriptional regulator [Bacteroidota bacterium]